MSAITDIQLLLNDAGVFWPENQVLDSLNQAQLEVFTKTKWARISTTFSLVRGQDFVTIPSSILVPSWIEGPAINSDGVADPTRFFPSTQWELETYSRLWRGSDLAQPRVFVLWDALRLRVYPRPDQPYVYTIWGVGVPTEITDSTTSLIGPMNYTLAVTNYSVALLLLATRPDLAQVFMSRSEDQILAFKKHLRNQQSHNIRQLRPASWFDIRQSGQIRDSERVWWDRSNQGGW